jgi:ferrous iron transport protein A
MTLDKGAIGQSYAVTKIDLPDQVEHRLEAIGMTIGGRVSILGSKDRGTLILKVRGARFAMGRGITEKIEVI